MVDHVRAERVSLFVTCLVDTLVHPRVRRHGNGPRRLVDVLVG